MLLVTVSVLLPEGVGGVISSHFPLADISLSETWVIEFNLTYWTGFWKKCPGKSNAYTKTYSLFWSSQMLTMQVIIENIVFWSAFLTASIVITSGI